MNDILALQAAVIRAAWRFAEHPENSLLKVELIQAVATHKEAAIMAGARDRRGMTLKEILEHGYDY